MSHPAETPRFSESEPEPEPSLSELSPDNYNFVTRAVYELAKSLRDEEFASSVTAWGLDQTGRLPHEAALSMLESMHKGAKEMIEARVAELKQLSERQLSPVRKFGSTALQRVRDLL